MSMKETKDFQLYTDVILVCDVLEEGIQAGDVGTVVERHDLYGLETGYSVEFFDMLGGTVANATLLPGSCLRSPTRNE